MLQASLWDEIHRNISWGTIPGMEFLAFMAEHYWGSSGLKFLDLGCGTGSSSIFLVNKGFQVTAVDISKVACDTLYHNIIDEKKHLVKIICSDILDLDLKENSFDCIIGIGIFDCLELEQSSILFDRIKKWLRPEGRLFGRVLASKIPEDIKRGNTRTRTYSSSEVFALLKEYKGVIKANTTYVSVKAFPITSWIFEAIPKLGDE